MTTDLATTAAPQLPEVIRFGVTKEDIAELGDELQPLIDKPIENRQDYLAASAGRKTVKKVRSTLERNRVNLKADAIAWGKKVDEAAKELKARLLTIEQPLEAKERAWEAEQQRMADEKAAAARAKLDGRLEQLTNVQKMMNPADVAKLTDAEFAEVLSDATAEHAERLRIEEEARQRREAEEAARKAEIAAEAKRQREAAEKLAAETREQQAAIRKQQDEIKAENERQRQAAAALKAAQDKLDAEREAAEQKEAMRLVAIERAEKEATLKAEREAREAEEAKQREVAVKAERKRQESLRPDREKLREVAASIDAIPLPDVSSQAVDILNAVGNILTDASAAIREITADPAGDETPASDSIDPAGDEAEAGGEV